MKINKKTKCYFDKDCKKSYGFILATGEGTKLIEKFNYQVFYETEIINISKKQRVNFEPII
jgi:hypothetical protein